MILEELREAIAERIPDIMESADEFGNSPFSLSDLADCIIIEVIKPIFEEGLQTMSPRARLIENHHKKSRNIFWAKSLPKTVWLLVGRSITQRNTVNCGMII